MTIQLTYTRLEKLGLVEIEVMEDPDWNPKDMVGDMYKGDPDGEREYIDSLHKDGVWMVVLRMRLHNQMPFMVMDSLSGIDSYDFADEGVREEMEAEAVHQFNRILSQLREDGVAK